MCNGSSPLWKRHQRRKGRLGAGGRLSHGGMAEGEVLGDVKTGSMNRALEAEFSRGSRLEVIAEEVGWIWEGDGSVR